jgi:hypothetical protein
VPSKAPAADSAVNKRPCASTIVMEATTPPAKQPRREQQVRGRHLYALFPCVHPAAGAWCYIPHVREVESGRQGTSPNAKLNVPHMK